MIGFGMGSRVLWFLAENAAPNLGVLQTYERELWQNAKLLCDGMSGKGFPMLLPKKRKLPRFPPALQMDGTLLGR